MFPNPPLSRSPTTRRVRNTKNIDARLSSLNAPSKTRQRSPINKNSAVAITHGGPRASRKLADSTRAAASTITLESAEDVYQEDDCYNECCELRLHARGALAYDRDVRRALRELETAIKLQQRRPKTKGRSLRDFKSIEPLWSCVEEYVLLLNREAVRSSEAVEPPETTQELFEHALQYVLSPKSNFVEATDGGIPVPLFSCWKAAACPRELPGVLRCLLLNNLAAHWRAMHRSSKEVVALLLHALYASGGALSTVVLYNLAAMFTATGHFDDAVESVARCIELAQRYLNWAEARAAAITDAFYTDEGELLIGSAVVELAAMHLVYAHILIAAISVWSECDARKTEHHCELASRCAAKYLAACHPLQKHCAAQVDLIRDRISSGSRSHRSDGGSAQATGVSKETVPPPQFPLLMIHGFLPSSLTFVRQWPPPIDMGTTTTYVAGVGMRASTILETVIAPTSPIPKDLHAFLDSVPRCLQQWEPKSGETCLGKLLRALRLEHLPRRPKRTTLSSRRGGSSKPRSVSRSHREDTPTPASGRESVGSTFVHLPPHRPEAPSACVVSELPCPVYDRYQRLQQVSLRALSPPSPRADPGRRTSLRVMRDLDADLRRFSLLVPVSEAALARQRLRADPVAWGRHLAAGRLQAWWRGLAARRERDRRAAAVASARRRGEAAATVLRALRRHRDAGRRHRAWVAARLARAAPLDAELRRLQGGLAAVAAAAASRQRCLALRAAQHRAVAAAGVLQAAWRGALARRRVRAIRAAARRVQGAWRQAQARAAVAARRAALRVAAEARWWAQEYEFAGQVLAIQRWLRGRRLIEAAKALVERRRRAVEAERAADEARFARKLGRWQFVEGLERGLGKVIAVLRGAKVREAMRAQHWKVLCVHRAITRWVLRMRGRALLDELRQLRDAKRAQQRHHEEVFAATTCIQRAVRLWLSRRSSAHKLEPLLVQKRLLVQEAFKMAAAAEEQKLERIRAYCAVMIQSVWRSYKCRQQVARYRQFITVIRRYQQENELARCAVVKLQAVARGFLARCRWQSRTQTIPLSSSSSSIEVHYISNPFESACVLSARSSEEECEAVEKNSAGLSLSVVPLCISDSDQAPTSCSVAPTTRQDRAATMIQKIWRGYWLRKCIECFCKEFDLEFSQENS